MGDWSPGAGGGDWLLPPQWAFDEELPQHPVSVPTFTARPALVPYTYRGSDHREPPEPTFTARPMRPVPLQVREATLLDDPALRYAGVPVSAPAGYIRDWEDR